MNRTHEPHGARHSPRGSREMRDALGIVPPRGRGHYLQLPLWLAYEAIGRKTNRTGTAVGCRAGFASDLMRAGAEDPAADRQAHVSSLRWAEM
jgi:hypothetical protein